MKTKQLIILAVVVVAFIVVLALLQKPAQDIPRETPISDPVTVVPTVPEEPTPPADIAIPEETLLPADEPEEETPVMQEPTEQPTEIPTEAPLIIPEALRSESAAGRDIAWATARQPTMHALVRENPQEALATALSPRQYALLPEALQALVEKPVTAEGFYGVLAICHHGADEDHTAGCTIQYEVVTGFGTDAAEGYRASIYGERHQRMTEENASIYGVVMDGHIALYEDDVVIIDDGEGFPGGRYAVYYRGQQWTTDDPDEARAIKTRLTSEQ